MMGEVHAALLCKGHALRFQEGPLGTGSERIERRGGAAKAVHHPVAGHADAGGAGAHGIAHQPGAPGPVDEMGQLAVGGNLPRRNLAHKGVDLFKYAAHTSLIS